MQRGSEGRGGGTSGEAPRAANGTHRASRNAGRNASDARGGTSRNAIRGVDTKRLNEAQKEDQISQVVNSALGFLFVLLCAFSWPFLFCTHAARRSSRLSHFCI